MCSLLRLYPSPLVVLTCIVHSAHTLFRVYSAAGEFFIAFNPLCVYPPSCVVPSASSLFHVYVPLLSFYPLPTKPPQCILFCVCSPRRAYSLAYVIPSACILLHVHSPSCALNPLVSLIRMWTTLLEAVFLLDRGGRTTQG